LNRLWPKKPTIFITDETPPTHNNRSRASGGVCN
jgi:hypothetical protein